MEEVILLSASDEESGPGPGPGRAKQSKIVGQTLKSGEFMGLDRNPSGQTTLAFSGKRFHQKKGKNDAGSFPKESHFGN